MKEHMTFKEILTHMEKTGSLPHNSYGLCYVTDNYTNSKQRAIFDLFEPTDADCDLIRGQGKSFSFWASDSVRTKHRIATGLRKTIIAFCAAINNEL